MHTNLTIPDIPTGTACEHAHSAAP